MNRVMAWCWAGALLLSCLVGACRVDDDAARVVVDTLVTGRWSYATPRDRTLGHAAGVEGRHGDPRGLGRRHWPRHVRLDPGRRDGQSRMPLPPRPSGEGSVRVRPVGPSCAHTGQGRWGPGEFFRSDRARVGTERRPLGRERRQYALFRLRHRRELPVLAATGDRCMGPHLARRFDTAGHLFEAATPMDRATGASREVYIRHVVRDEAIAQDTFKFPNGDSASNRSSIASTWLAEAAPAPKCRSRWT